jgi:AcrR family transcriptional regulator
MVKQHLLYNTSEQEGGSMDRPGDLLVKRQKREVVVKKVAGNSAHIVGAAGCAGQEPIDPRVRRTRKLLGDALRSLMKERSFSAISVQDIAERATVNRATFYAHYPGKEELAASVLQDDLNAALARRFSQCPSLSPEDLTTIAVSVFEFVGSMHTDCQAEAAHLESVAGQALQNGLYELMEGWLSHNNAYKQRFPGISKETIATMLAWGIYGAALRWSASPRRPPAEQVCREIVALFFAPHP